jgi:PAS domain S-box-containing protein
MAEEEHKAILRTATDGFWLLDVQGQFLDVNEVYCHLIDYSREELLNMQIADIETMESPEVTMQHIRRIMVEM